jgi:hypothetical protein
MIDTSNTDERERCAGVLLVRVGVRLIEQTPRGEGVA